MKSFHFISTDENFLAKIVTHPYTSSIIKLYESQEKFTTYLKSSNENFVFLDVDFNSELENIKNITKINQTGSNVIVVSQDKAFAYNAIKAGIHDYVLKSNFIQDSLLIYSQYPKSHNKKEQLSNKIAIHCDDAVHYLRFNDIIRCKAESNYTRIVMEGRNILIAKTLKKIEALLPSSNFYRTHRSHIANIQHIKMIKHEKGGMIVTSDDFNMPISRNRKRFILDKVQSSMT